MIKTIIFDCFGVIYPNFSYDFSKRHKNIFGNSTTFLDELNLQIDLGKITKMDFFNSLGKEVGIPANEIQAEADEQLVVDLQVIDLIKKLKTQYKIALLSNAGKEEIECIYKDKYDVLFDNITVSYQLGIVKPHKEIFLACIEKLEVTPEECLFIDDSKKNVDAAVKLGVQGFVYTDYNSLVNYLEQLAIM